MKPNEKEFVMQQQMRSVPQGISFSAVAGSLNDFAVGKSNMNEMRARLMTETLPCALNPLMDCKDCAIRKTLSSMEKKTQRQFKEQIPCGVTLNC